MSSIATFCAMSFLVGVTLVIQWIRSTRRQLWRDITPYVNPRDVRSKSQHHDTVVSLSLITTAIHLLERPWGSDTDCALWLRQSGTRQTLTQFRIRQLTSALALSAVGMAWFVTRWSANPQQSIPMMFVLGVLVVCAGWLSKQRLISKVKRRTTAIEHELAHTLELLAFTIAAGEPFLGAMQRVAVATQGVLADQLHTTVRSIGLGRSIAHGLSEMSASSSSTALERAVQSLHVALERGTPLAEVLRSQAGDARAHHKRTMLELAGKKETTMMIPVVFMILPLIVAVAIYPGLVALNLM